MPENSQNWIALLGRQDEPTDALEDYCHLLAGALGTKGCSLELFRICWAEKGWKQSLMELGEHVASRRGAWALVQYTALAWSRRGFPVRFISVIRYLKSAGLKVVIVFHDPQAFPGYRLRDRIRRQLQLAVMRHTTRLADKIVSTVSIERVSWMQAQLVRTKVLSVPVGSNLPVPARQVTLSRQESPVIVVFGMSNPQAEAALIAGVVLRAAKDLGRLHLKLFGREVKLIETTLQKLLEGSQVHLEVFGILPGDQASALLSNADVQLFVRSGLSSRRGSAIAGITCGLPIVGFAGDETAFPITEAGVRLVPLGDANGLFRELVSVLQDDALRKALRNRSLDAAEKYFSWDCIALKYLSALGYVADDQGF
jgi:glycosyltransferase involved in cell wall biosynthesis